MVAAIADYCRRDRPAGAGEPGGVRARDPREPRVQVPRRARIAARSSPAPPSTEIRIVGGGSRNRLLNQFTADATGRTVVAGPVEATRARQHRHADGRRPAPWRRSREARRIIERFVPGRAVRAGRRRIAWNAHYRRFQRVPGADLCLKRPTRRNDFPEESLGRRARRRRSKPSRSSSCATGRTCLAPISASRTSAAATRARSSICPIR